MRFLPTIRDVQPADIAAVRDVLVATWHTTYDALLGSEKVTEITNSWHSLENLTRQIGVPQTTFLIAEAEGQIVATSHARLAEDGSLALERLYVLPEKQGLGIGKALLRETIARFPGASRLTLEVEPQNKLEIRFYERNGFREMLRSACCGGRSELSAIVMEKALLP